MKLRHLRYFIAVAEELNFTRAAQRLQTSQPSLSQQILLLEEEIGFPLLARTKRRVELTEVGKVFLSEARQAVMQVEHAVNRARRAGRHNELTLKISFAPSAEVRLLPTLLPALRLHHPALQISLYHLGDDEQELALLRGDIDAALVQAAPTARELMTHLIDSEPLLIFLPANHRLSRARRISPQMLDGETRVASDPQHARLLCDLADHYLSRHGVHSPVALQAGHILRMLNLVGNGAGYALLPAHAAAMADDSVCVRQFDTQPPEIELRLAYRADNTSPVVPTLYELLCPTDGTRHHKLAAVGNIPPDGSTIAND